MPEFTNSAMNTTELFDDFIDGDDAYNSIFEDLDVPFAEEIITPSFNCLGEVNIKEIQISHNGFYFSKYGPESLFNEQSYDKGKIQSITLFGKTWDKATCLFNYLEQLFKLASMELMMLDDASVIHCGSITAESNIMKRNYFQIRTNCIELILFTNDFINRVLSFKEYEKGCEILLDKLNKKIITLRKQLGEITNLPEYIYLFCCNTSGNKCEEAGYHVIHCRLDLLWLDIHVSSSLQKYKANHKLYVCQYYVPLYKQLFQLALVRFSKMDGKDVSKKSPFSCTCIQEIWLMLQIISDNNSTNNSDQGFWSIYQSLLLSFLKLRSSSLEISSMETGSTTIPVNQFKFEMTNLTRTSSYYFSIWFTYHLARLYTFNKREMKSNYSLIEVILKNVLSDDLNEDDLRKHLYFFEKLCCELWSVKTEPILILWEYFQKRLNQIFYIPGQDLDTIINRGNSALSLLSQVKGRIEDPYLVRNSYEHFLRIVGLHLSRCQDIIENQRHLKLLTGRIYSKLTPSKLLTLNQTGEQHFVSLYLTLAVSADLNQVVNKFSDVCTCYGNTKGSLSYELLKGQLALCILSIERGLPIDRLIPPITKTLANIDTDKHRELFSLSIEAFSDLLDHHHSLNLGQHLFIDNWINKYLLSCSQSESIKLLDLLLSLVNRINTQIQIDPNNELCDIIERVWTEISSYLLSSSSTNNIILSDIAASLASIYLTISNMQRFNAIIQLFSNNNTSNSRIVQRFIVQLVDNNRIKGVLTNLDVLIVETWIRCNILLKDNEESDRDSLTVIVSELSDVQRICTHTSMSRIVNSQEPLIEFFTAILTNYNSIKNENEKVWLCNKISYYLKDLDKWLKPILSNCQSESSQQISHVYLIVGTMFSLISHLLYVKSKPNSLIQSLINIMLLPVSLHNSDSKIHHYLLNSVRKTLHLFLQGLNQLGPSSDPYINRCIKELILLYIPRCISNTGPLPSQCHISTFSLVSLFSEFDKSLQKLILENISNNFFRTKARNPLPNTIHAVRFMKEVLLLNNNNETVLLSLLEYSMEYICDIIMYCDNKTSVFIMSKELIKLYFDNHTLKHSNLLSNEVEELLSKLCTNNLAWSSRQLFDFLFLLCSYINNIMKRYLPKLLQHIKLIENKRGVTNDKVLRLGYERIQSKLSS